MIRIGAFLGLVRVNFLPASVLPFLLGVVFALSKGYDFRCLEFCIALFGVVAGHLAANSANNYCDNISGADGIETITTPFFGGSKVLSSAVVSCRVALLISAFFSLAAVLSGVMIFFFTNDLIFIFMAGVVAFLAVEYSAAPLRFSCRGLGEGAIFLIFGPFLVMGGYYLFSRVLSFESLLLSFIPAGLIWAVIICNEIPDAVTDKKARKYNLVVRLGEKHRSGLYLLGVLLSFLCLASSIMMKILPFVTVLCFLFYLMNIKALRIISKNDSGVELMIEAARSSVMAHFFVTASIMLILFFMIWL